MIDRGEGKEDCGDEALAKSREWQLPLLRFLVLLMAGLWAFSPPLQGSWLWDDNGTVTTNPYIHDLRGLKDIWWGMAGPDYWPLTSTMLWVEWHFWDDNPVGYRLVSLGLHIFSGFLVGRILERLGLRWGWLGGLLFVIHPLSVESVSWISELKNALSLPFFLLSLDAYLDHEQGRANFGYVRSVACYLAAVLCKSSVIMLPAVLLLYAYWKRGKINLRDLREIASFWAVALLFGLITIYFQQRQGIFETVVPMGPWARLAGAATAFFFYLGAFLAPIHLVPIYPRWPLDPPTPLQDLAVPALLALLTWLWTQRKGWGHAAFFGFGFFLLNLLPVVGFIQMSYTRISLVADHFVYLPMIGLIGLTVAGFEWAERRLASSFRALPWAAAATLVMPLILLTHRYAGVFTTQETLWNYTLIHNPGCKEAHNNLGIMFFQMGRPREALEHLREAVRINPGYAQAHNNLGFVLEDQGQIQEARAEYAEALRINPYFNQAADNLVRVLKQKFPASPPAVMGKVPAP